MSKLDDALNEIEAYLEDREDADGVPSGGGYRPNEEMRLLMALRDARAEASLQLSQARQDNEMMAARLTQLEHQPEGGPSDIEAKYYELLFAVARKHPGETRHETALRYIRAAESQTDNRPCQASPQPQNGTQK